MLDMQYPIQRFANFVPLLLCPFEPLHQSAQRSLLYALYPTNYNIFPDTLNYAKQTQSQVGEK